MGCFGVALQSLCHRKSIHAAHHHIENQQVEARQILLQRLFCRVCGGYLVPLGLKIELQNLAEVLLVVDDHNSSFVFFHISCLLDGGAR